MGSDIQYCYQMLRTVVFFYNDAKMKGEQGFGPSFHSFYPPPLAHRTTFFQNFRALVGRLNVKPFLGLRQVSRVSLRGKKFL